MSATEIILFESSDGVVTLPELSQKLRQLQLTGKHTKLITMVWMSFFLWVTA